MIIKKCLFCNKEFQSIRNKRKYCSIDCFRKKEQENWKDKRENLKCQYCGKKFTSLKVLKRKFCSVSCGNRGQKRKGKWLNCLVCNKEFYLHPNLIKKGRRYCSIKCSSLDKKGKYRGKNNPNWKGGKYLTKAGYIMISYFDKDDNRKIKFEHRSIMEQKLGRELYKWENVHHLDGNKQNNKIHNLELWIKPQPTGIRLNDFLDRYKDYFISLSQTHQD